MIRPVRQAGWAALSFSVTSLRDVDYAGARGLSLVQFVKIPVAAYVFLLGYDVYPLTWIIVIPAFILAGVGLIAGIWELRRDVGLIVLLAYLLVIPFVYLVFDSLAPPYTETASPRHVSAAWPALIALIIVGLSRNRFLILLFLSLQLIFFGYRLAGNWSYLIRPIDWPSIAEQFDADLIIHDGRASDPINVYFESTTPHQRLWKAEKWDSAENILLVTNHFATPEIEEVVSSIDELQSTHVAVDLDYKYPAFVYTLVRRDLATMMGDQFSIPMIPFGVEFADLDLPLEIRVNGGELKVGGSYPVPSYLGDKTLTLPLSSAAPVEELILVSNLFAGESLTRDEQVAAITIVAEDGSRQTVPLRLGENVERWDRTCSTKSECQTVHQWHKRIAFVGQRSYPGAYRDFQAGLHAAKFTLPSPKLIERFEVEYTADSGQLHIWGVALQ